MLFAFALLSSLGYSLQTVLLVRYARRMDALSLVFYRNISFAVTLLPLLLLASPGDIRAAIPYIPHFAVAGVLGALYLLCVYEGLRSLSAGSQSALTSAASTLAVLVGGVFLGESLSITAYVLVLILSSFGVLLAFAHKHFDHLDGRLKKGIFLTILSGVPGAGTKMVLAHITQDINPFVAGYLWEVFIGLASIALISIIFLYRKEHLQRVPLKTALGIALVSSPTLIGTGAFALAITLGPLSIVQAVNSGSFLVFMGLLAMPLYKEHLGIRQWIPILGIATSIILLKLFS